jgi:hypothetical protein
MKYIAPVVALGLLCCPAPSLAQVVLAIDDLPAGFTNGCPSQGATFNFPIVRDYAETPGFAHSGTKAVELCFAIEFCQTPLNVQFTERQARFKVFVGFTSPLSQPSLVALRALDQNGMLVAEATAVLGPSTAPIPVQVPLEVTSSGRKIQQITVGFASNDAFNNGLVFDDLEFDTEGRSPVCTALLNPEVTLSEPQLNTTVQINEFTLRGMVATAAPLEEATLTVTAPGNTRITNLLGTIIQPTGGPFGAIRVDEALFPGTNTLTVTARIVVGRTKPVRQLSTHPCQTAP